METHINKKSPTSTSKLVIIGVSKRYPALGHQVYHSLHYYQIILFLQTVEYQSVCKCNKKAVPS